MALGKTIFFKKLSEGSISLYLSDVDGVLPQKWFRLDQKMPRIGVPENYALSLFTDAVIEKMMKKNYFEIEELANLVKIAEERGIIAPSEEEKAVMVTPKRTQAILLAILKGGNEAKIRELFDSSDRNRALELATANALDLSGNAVAVIEKVLGMAITEE
jgi:hypothetical protein